MDGDIFQAILLAFVFMAYLILVFVIVGDLMRDHELSGWWKAVWIIALILIPWLTGLIYLILITYVPQISLWLPSVLLGE